jgi:hypothetical protein
VLSVSSPGTQFLPIEDNRRLCRQLNEELDAIVQAHPRRFANLAALPLPDVDAALKEVDFAFNRGFDGIGLFSSYEGKYLGDPLFDPVLEKLNERGATIFIHPAQPAAFDKIGLGLPSPILEFPFDSTRMLTNLLRSGALGRFGNLKLVVPHGGGTVPFLATRITGSVARFPGRGGPIAIASAMQQLRSVHYGPDRDGSQDQPCDPEGVRTGGSSARRLRLSLHAGGDDRSAHQDVRWLRWLFGRRKGHDPNAKRSEAASAARRPSLIGGTSSAPSFAGAARALFRRSSSARLPRDVARTALRAAEFAARERSAGS